MIKRLGIRILMAGAALAALAMTQTTALSQTVKIGLINSYSGFLAQAAAKMQGQQPGMLGQLLGGGGGGLGGMLGSSGGSGMMGNPMAKAALAGIAAFAAKKMMSR